MVDDDTRPEVPAETSVATVADTPRRIIPAGGDLKTRYRSLSVVGHGAQGAVVAVRDDALGRDVAIKRMLAANPTDDEIARFVREARIQGSLDHPAIPPVHELARDATGRPYFVMKLLAGTTLRAILTRLAQGEVEAVERFTRERLLRAFADVCLAVELAHTRGVVHRDLKPENIMLGDFGEVFVIDWGVAKIVGRADPAFRDLADRDDSHTHVGAVIGTPRYMAPEQRTGLEVDARADVYALGLVLFEILTLQPPASERSPLRAAPDRAVPPELDALCLDATIADRDARTITARQLAERVQQYLDGDRDHALRGRLAREHLDAARAALSHGDESSAMRDAGQAMALDPRLGDAVALVGRLMLDPPRQLPSEVEEELARDDAETQARRTRTSMPVVLSYIPLIGYLVWAGASPSYIAVLAAAAIVITIVFALGRTARGVTFLSRPLALAALAGNATVLIVVARLFSPFMFAPPVATVMLVVVCTGPAYRETRMMVLAMVVLIAAILVPYAGEALGWLAPTMHISDGTLAITPFAASPDALQIRVGLCAFVTVVVAAIALPTLVAVRGEHAARRSLHLQAWRLAQLTPHGAAVRGSAPAVPAENGT